MPYEPPKPVRARSKKNLPKNAPSIPGPPHAKRATCTRCTRDYSRQKGYFSASQSPMWRVNNGYLPVCKLCVEEMYNNYKDSLGDDRVAMRRVCMHLDIYWNDAIYDMACEVDSSSSRISTYNAKANLKRFLGKTFDDTLAEEAAARGDRLMSEDQLPDTDENGNPIARKAPPSYADINSDDILFWGPGYDAEYYVALNKRMREFCDDPKELPPAERMLYSNICLLQERIIRDGANGLPVEKNMSMLNTLLGSVGEKPSQKKTSDDSVFDQTPMGVWIQRFENERPIPDVDPELADVDGLISKVNTWVRGHLAKMLGIKNSYSKMYDEAIERLRVEHPEFADDDEEELLYDVYGGESE